MTLREEICFIFVPSKFITMVQIKLTIREREIYQLILLGRSNQKIGDELFISINTVKTHVAKILAKKNATNRIELITKQNK